MPALGLRASRARLIAVAVAVALCFATRVSADSKVSTAGVRRLATAGAVAAGTAR